MLLLRSPLVGLLVSASYATGAPPIKLTQTVTVRALPQRLRPARRRSRRPSKADRHISRCWTASSGSPSRVRARMQRVTYCSRPIWLARRDGDVPRHGAQLVDSRGRHIGAGADQRLGHAAPVRRVLGIRARGAMGPPRPGLRRPEPALLAHRRVRHCRRRRRAPVERDRRPEPRRPVHFHQRTGRRAVHLPPTQRSRRDPGPLPVQVRRGRGARPFSGGRGPARRVLGCRPRWWSRVPRSTSSSGSAPGSSALGSGVWTYSGGHADQGSGGALPNKEA